MRRRRRTQPTDSPISGVSLPMIDFLLNGHTRSSDEVDQLRTEGVAYDQFEEFDWTTEQLEAAWRANRRPLLAEWKRRGGVGEPHGVVFERESTPQRDSHPPRRRRDEAPIENRR